MATRGGRPRPARRAATAAKPVDAHNLAGLQQSFATSLHQVDAGHSLTPKPLCRLGGARGKHYIAGFDGALAPGLKILNQSQPTRLRALRRHCSVSFKNTAVRRGRNHLVHRLSDQAQKLACAAQRHRAFSCFHELFREWMVSECRKLTVGWSCKAVGKGESCTVGVNAPTADGPVPNGAGLLHHRDAFF